LPGIVAAEIIGDIRFVHTTTKRGIPGAGKTVVNAEDPLKRKCMYGMARMNIILRNWRIRLLINPRDVPNVGR
jgi:hypothetical protein